MEAAIIGLLGVLVGAVIITSSNYLLAVRKEKTEAQNWRRDRVLEAYSEFVSVTHAAASEATTVYAAHCATEEHAKHCKILFDKLAEMYRAKYRMRLLAPDSLWSHIDALTAYIGGDLAMLAMQCPKACADEREKANTKLSGLEVSFTERARHDIGIHPKKLWWWVGL